MEQAKIVIVDDDQDIRDTLQHILEGRQYTVITASNKEDGLEKIRAEMPDLAMLDVMMEAWQDGFELARTLKKDPDLKHIPILMLTGVRDQTGIDFKSTAGDPTWLPVDGYLEKPAEPNTLLAEVERLLTEKNPDSPGS
jgi:CheY-like chemotaxis protein